jgi:hypothetical protein
MPTLPCLNESHQKKTNSNFTIPAHTLSVVHIVQYILKVGHRFPKKFEMHTSSQQSKLNQAGAHAGSSGVEEALAWRDAL